MEMEAGKAQLTLDFSHKELADTAFKGELAKFLAKVWQVGYTVTGDSWDFGQAVKQVTAGPTVVLPDLGALSAKEAVALIQASSLSTDDLKALAAQEKAGKARKTVLAALS